MLSQEIIDAIEKEAIIITAGQRLSRELINSYSRHMQNQGKTAWNTPKIYPLQHWCNQYWLEQEIRNSGTLLLNESQELSIWEDIIRTDPESNELLQITAAARIASKAWMLLNAYQVDPDVISHPYNEDVKVFLKWLKKYRKILEADNWIDNSQLLASICNALERDQKDSHIETSTFLFCGFDEITPHQEKFIELLRSRNIQIIFHEQKIKPRALARTVCPDNDREIRAAAQWARHLLQTADDITIGVVVPQLQQLRSRVAHIFEDVLLPASVLQGACDGNHLFNISLGQYLANIPIIRDALLLLRFAQQRLDYSEISYLLHSPYMAGGESESLKRAGLDVELRRNCEVKTGIKTVAYYASKEDTACPMLAGSIDACLEITGTLNRKCSTYTWSRVFTQVLTALGWPGERELDSDEYQAVHAFRGLLDELSGLHAVCSKLGYFHALNKLSRMASQRIHQPESPFAPIQIMGIHETTGLTFDYLWITGMDDESWPVPTNPNPFLPISLQCQAGMPHADHEREMMFASRITDRLLSSANEIIVSSPARRAEQPLRISDFFSSLEQVEIGNIIQVQPDYMQNLCSAGIEMSQIDDNQGLAINTDDITPGGTRIFKDQAACAFQAFARHRLAAKSLEEPVEGITAAERGNIVHSILESIWKELGDRKSLVNLTSVERKKLFGRVIREELDKMRQRKPHVIGRRFYQLEENRLMELMQNWFEIELQRENFIVIRPEKEQVLSVAGLPVRIRPDRIDQMDNGKTLIFDYKTGDARPNNWFGDRPEEPQMPIYALAEENRLAGLCYAKIRRGDTGISGFVDKEVSLPGVKPMEDWGKQLADWRKVLETLAEDYINGNAQLNPKHPDVCRYCDIMSLCHVTSLRGFAFENEDNE